MNRILIIGTSGCGKSTLAKRVSERLQIPFFPSDEFYWEPRWKIATQDKVHRLVWNIVYQDTWILDGNFDEIHDLVWRRADCIIWLDYPLLTIFGQILTRNFRWVLTRQKIWSGNTMTLQRAISGIHHMVNSYSQKKKKYPFWLSEIPNIVCHRFRARDETEMWFENITKKEGN
jgi:adenylate kinase family enzyme